MYHTTREGQKMLIASMTDAHLKNTIDLGIKNITECQKIIESDVAIRSNLDYITSGITTENLKKEAEAKLKMYISLLPGYIFEACIRGISYTDKLQAIYGRKEMIDLKVSNALPDYSDSDDEYDYDENDE